MAKRAFRVATRSALVMLAVGVLGAAIVVKRVTAPVRPPPTHADAVLVLYGETGRLQAALALMKEGLAPVLVVELQPGEQGLFEDAAGIVDGPPPFTVVRLPTPDTTRDEVRQLAALAKSRSWHHVVLVTSTFHVQRSELLLRRCYPGQVSSVGVRSGLSDHQQFSAVLHELGGLAYAVTWGRGC
jgi:uncharacterized SAM-binding protein YcdF (DUF218 family)